ncbi:DUF1189 family protein [Pullulanibacillus sp. KACC 23026]|uniref:DUF1189 family protein n=1 Tax=Pullulanibacillus sp. KACC 23026 TaxID=3028315 RepID=UPI0023AFA6D5|nr:DUF1189 family protein [Pullulanibacillus sp. KACC 23026]WEG14258.1 DUF1189 family protein [Pullulanibacillus sp. KACC 23026]
MNKPKQKQSSLFFQFYENLRHPRKSSLFRFKRAGQSILYSFFLTLIAALLFSPAVIRATIRVGQSFSFIFLPFGIIYYYIVLTFLFFSFISILSIIGYWVNRLLFKRRLNGQQVWSLSVNAATWPTLIFSASGLFVQLPSGLLLIYTFMTFGMLINMILAIPKPKTSSPRPRERSNLEKQTS